MRSLVLWFCFVDMMKKTGKKWISFDFETSKDADAFRKPKAKNTLVERKYVDFNFEAKLSPKHPQDLAVHPKKVQEVESWLRMEHKSAGFLLLTGPTGSGKSATIRVLSKKLNLSISEWSNPLEVVDQDSKYGTSQGQRFAEFLAESKWGSLFVSQQRVILIEEFPNALIQNPLDFANILQDCYDSCKCMVVFVCSDSSTSNSQSISDKLFPQELRIKLNIAEISFNQCAPTLMKIAMKRANELVHNYPDLFETPSGATIDAIIATSMGDIRSALNQYYIASLPGTLELQTSCLPKQKLLQQKTGTKRKRNENTFKIKSMFRDENLGLFHGLGRVLNPKRIEYQNSWRLHCDVKKIIDEFSTQPGIFTAFLFENYIKYFGDITEASNAASLLSLSQVFLEKWGEGKHEVLLYALWVSVLGLMVNNEHRVSKWTQIRGPVKVQKRIRDYNLNVRNLDVTDLFYCNKIEKNQIQTTKPESDEDNVEIEWE